MKYYLVTTYTCYCGEHFYHYVAIPDGESPSDEKWADLFYGWVADDAAEWWDEQSEEEYDSYDDYISECGYDIEEISEEEYRRDLGKEGVSYACC